jgi:hypothetical protein
MRTLPIVVATAFTASLLALPATGQTRFTTLYTFTGGAAGELTSAAGVLYTAFSGPTPTGSKCGGILELQPPTSKGGVWTETVLYGFAQNNDLCSPSSGPVVGAGGVLYGLTGLGGAYAFGGLYELQPPAAPGAAWTESVLYSFAIDTGGPASSLVPGPGGSFYVLTGVGALFQLHPPAAPGGTWSGTSLYNLSGGVAGPVSLTTGPHGALYGTVAQGGTAPGGLGEVFQLTPPAAPGETWTETVLHNFGYGGAYAGNPNSLTVASNGAIYGTTYGYDLIGGAGMGSVFELAPPASPGGVWTYSVLQDFGGYHANPRLILRNRNIYGGIVTPQGGDIFQMQPPSTLGGAWTTTYLYQFSNGQGPYIDLMDQNGTMYGTTSTFVPGQPFYGTIFQLATK